MATENPSFLSLFCGCGGFDLGFKQAGFHCLSAFDSDQSAIEVHRHNLRSSAQRRDLSQVEARADLPSGVDVIVAGPPCQGFSTAGKRDIMDPRNGMLTIPAIFASILRPKVVIVENVTGAKAGVQKKHWDDLVSQLRSSGYRTADLACNAALYGVPQERRRLILIAWNTGSEVVMQIPQLKGGVLRAALSNVGELPNHVPRFLPSNSEAAKIAARIGPSQKLSNVRAGPRSVHTWEIPEVYGRTNREERNVLDALLRLRRRDRKRDFGDADPVSANALWRGLGSPVAERLRTLEAKGYVKRVGKNYDLVHTFNGKYRRLAWDQPSPTVDTRFGDPRYFLHPIENRGFSVREAARIQGFPDSFVFQGTLKTQYRLVGNAVPPPLAANVAAFVRDALLKS